MTDAIHLLVEVVRKKHGSVPVDAIALSLGCEYLARAAVERPESIGTVGMVCPTGFEKEAGSLAFSVSLERPRLMRLLAIRGVGRALFEVLTLRPVIRHFLRGTWGRRSVDEGLLEYDYLATHQPGAEYAPLRFVAGYLFSPDRDRLYRSITQPVWVVRGVRGDFVDYAGLKSMTQNPQWTVVTLRTGSLPHFELPQQFIHRFERWAAAVRPSAPKSGAVALFQ
jgi:pimeloyl-ACP methyl ester carboxylesterase